jgi:hypothetical protein
LTCYRPLVLVLIVALPVASGAACGGDEEAPPTRQEFIRQADAICRSAEQDLSSASKQAGFYSPEPTPRKEAEFIEEKIIPIFQTQLDEIRELTPPSGEKEKIEAALAAAERDLGDLREDPSRVPTGLRELNRLFQRYGSNTSSGCG